MDPRQCDPSFGRADVKLVGGLATEVSGRSNAGAMMARPLAMPDAAWACRGFAFRF